MYERIDSNQKIERYKKNRNFCSTEANKEYNRLKKMKKIYFFYW